MSTWTVRVMLAILRSPIAIIAEPIRLKAEGYRKAKWHKQSRQQAQASAECTERVLEAEAEFTARTLIEC